RRSGGRRCGNAHYRRARGITPMSTNSWLEAANLFDGCQIGDFEAEGCAATSTPVVPILPDTWVITIGGQSIMDRGRSAVYPILEELVAAREEGINFILGVGGG